jgi:membrane-bound serine protease (ClpP class)
MMNLLPAYDSLKRALSYCISQALPSVPNVLSRTAGPLTHRLLPLILSAITVTAAPAQIVHVITVEATINPATAEYVHEGIKRAAEEGAECLVIRLNTPGGLLKSTRSIVTDLLTSGIPVIVYVHPSGAQSASAGAFITLAAHIAAMAPGTNIGAAHPVGIQGEQPDSIMNEKATNDAAAFIRSISERRHRNVRWAEDAVRKSVSITETEALRDSVIDLVASSTEVLLDSVDGRTVDINGTPRTLHTKDAQIVEHEMGLRYRILDTLSDPNVAYILLLLGIYGLLFELYNPGAILPGVVGAICIVLAFYSLHTLPINYAGLALILIGVILFLLEIKITSYGMLTIGGIISLFLGSIMLIKADSPLEFIRLSWTIVIPSVLLTAVFFAFALGLGIRAQKRKPVTGAEGLIGEHGRAISDLNPEGRITVHGEIWNATAGEGNIKSGTDVTVESVSNLRLIVRKRFASAQPHKRRNRS